MEYTREERPCNDCVWHTDTGCYSYECKPLTREQVKDLIAPLKTIEVEDELKACPFCGSNEIEIALFGECVEAGGDAVMCMNCGAMGSQYKNRGRAIKAWNMRAEGYGEDESV